MTTDPTPIAELETGNGFWVRSANEWSRKARKRPVPRFLFGEFWLEGELAVQIVESIARRRHIGPLRNEAGQRNVV